MPSPADAIDRRALALVAAAALTAAVGVALGAFAAHVLEKRLEARDLTIFETAVRYHLLHALGMLAAAAVGRGGLRGALLAGWLMLAGVVMFSGSLYVLVATNTRWLGAVTPLGGTLLIAGWLTLAASAWRARR